LNHKSFFTYSNENEEGKNYILLHCTKPEWLVLNNSALEIAQSLENEEFPDAVIENLVLKYGISRESANQDVLYVLEQLKNKGFLSKAETSEVFKRPILKSLFFHLTTRCNLKCPHCYVASEMADLTHPAKEELPPYLLFRLIDEFSEHNGKTVTFSGGEPLLYPQFKDAVEYAASKGLETEILTNGTLIDKEWAALFADKKISVQISLDGSTAVIHDTIRGKGNFDKAVRGIKYLQDAGMKKRITLCTTIMKQNLHDLPAIISLANNLEITKIRFLPLRKVGSAEKKWDAISGMDTAQYESFFQYISCLQKDKNCGIDLTCGLTGFMLNIPKNISDDDIWCPVGKQIVADTNGDAYPCVLMMKNEFRLGNLFSQTLSQLMQSDKMSEIYKILSTRRNIIAKCAVCNWRNFCQSGCMGQALDHKGTVWDTDDFCTYRKRAYKEAFDKILKN